MNNRLKEAVNDVVNTIADNEELQVRVDVFTGNITIYNRNTGLEVLEWRNDPKIGDSLIRFYVGDREFEAMSVPECDQEIFREYEDKNRKRFVIGQGQFLERLFNGVKWKYKVDD